MALDEASTALLGAFAQTGAKPLHEQDVQDVRAGAAMAVQMSPRGPEVDEVIDHEVAVSGGSIVVREYLPEAPTAAIVFYHGGGWVLGSLDESDLFARTLADRLNAVVLSVEYRLAPDHRFPVATDDAWSAFLWADAHVRDRRSALPLVLFGESAGGTLAAVVAQRAERENGPRARAQILAYPATDSDFERASYVDPANQLMLSRDSMIWFWNHYADLGQRADPAASPIRAEDLTGLPPAIILTAEHDPLRDEGEEYADRLAAAGGVVAARRFRGQMHGFASMVGMLPGAADALDYIAEHLAEVLAAREGERA